MSVFNWEVNSPSSFASFFILVVHNSPVNLKLINFQLWTKESHQSPDFETFTCCGENIANSSCHFWEQKSFFLQILHQYLVLPNITPLYSFKSNIIYFGQRQPIKVKMFEIFKYSGQNSSKSSCQFWKNKSWQITLLLFLSSYFFYFGFKRILSKSKFWDFEVSGENFPNSSCHFWKQKSVFLQVLYQYSVLSNITPLYFFRLNIIIYFDQRQPIKVQILRFLSAWIKIRQIAHADFELRSQFLFNFCIILHSHDT